MPRWIILCLLLIPVGLEAADLPVVHCPQDPPTVRTLAMVERWRVSADDEDAPLMGVVSRVRTTGPGGDLYLLDRQLCQVLVYSAEGEYLNTLGRKGEGPGEFDRPYEFELLADGSLAIRNGWPAKLVFLNPDGTPGGGWQPKATLSLNRYRRVPGGWICNGTNRNEEKTEENRIYSDAFIARFDDDGNQILDFATGEILTILKPRTYDESRPYFPGYLWELTADEEIVISTSREEYRLEYFDLEGNPVRTVTRDFERRRRSNEDKEEIRETTVSYRNGVKQETEHHLLDHDPVIEFLHVFRDGSLMVYTCYGQKDLPEGMALRYDLHDPSGALTERVEIMGQFERDFDRLFVVGRDRLVVLRNYDATIRAAYNRPDEDAPVREDDDIFAVVVYDLVEIPLEAE